MRGDGVFEVVYQQSGYAGFEDAYTIGWRSDRFRAQQTLHLRHGWGRNCDPRDLVRFIEELVGTTLRNFDQLRLHDGEATVQALLPHFEREIHLFMERMEAGHRNRHRRIDSCEFYPDLSDPLGFRQQEDPEAKKKATALLVKNLDEKQQETFTKKREFETVGKDGKTYRITANRSFNVIGPDGTKYCGQTADTPVEDQMLAQKLLLEHEPEKFFKNANVSRPATTGTTAMEIMMRHDFRDFPIFRAPVFLNDQGLA